MKKILIILIMFFSCAYLKVDALEYYDIEVSTLFEENIEFDEVPTINLSLYVFNPTKEDDIGDLKEQYELTKENNYSTIIKDALITDDVTLEASIKGDDLGLFDCKLEFTEPIDNVAKITITVTRNNYEKHDVKISKDSVFKVYGITTSSSNQTTTTKITESVEETIKKEQEQIKKEEQNKKNNQITNILFITIGIIIVIGVIFVTIKFVNSNK